MIEAYLPDSAKGDFRLVYNLDIGKTRTLLEPVTVTVSNFDFDYYEYSNLASWVYHIHPEEEEFFPRRMKTSRTMRKKMTSTLGKAE